MDRNLETLQLVKKLGETKVNILSPLSIVADQKGISLWFASDKQELSCYSRSLDSENWAQQSFKVKPILGSQLTITKINDKMWLFFRDPN